MVLGDCGGGGGDVFQIAHRTTYPPMHPTKSQSLILNSYHKTSSFGAPIEAYSALIFVCFHKMECISSIEAFRRWRHSYSKRFQWRRKVTFLWRDYYFTRSFCAKIHLWAMIQCHLLKALMLLIHSIVWKWTKMRVGNVNGDYCCYMITKYFAQSNKIVWSENILLVWLGVFTWLISYPWCLPTK